MKKYYVYYLIQDGESIPVDYCDVDDENIEAYGNASFTSYVNNYIKDFPDEEKEKKAEEHFKDIEFMISEKGFEIVLPSWCKESQGDFDQVAYLVVDRRKKGEDAFVGLYANEYDAWRLCHDTISGEDLEFVTPAPIYYVRLFKLTVKNVMPIGEEVYAKYDYESMKFDI